MAAMYQPTATSAAVANDYDGFGIGHSGTKQQIFPARDGYSSSLIASCWTKIDLVRRESVALC
jgi:hypothetical protein